MRQYHKMAELFFSPARQVPSSVVSAVSPLQGGAAGLSRSRAHASSLPLVQNTTAPQEKPRSTESYMRKAWAVVQP